MNPRGCPIDPSSSGILNGKKGRIHEQMCRDRGNWMDVSFKVEHFMYHKVYKIG